MTKPTPPLENSLRLEPGDRVPNFVLPNHEDRYHAFYSLTLGDALLLIFYANSGDDQVVSELRAVQRLFPRFADQSAEIMVVNQDSVRRNAEVKAEFPTLDEILSEPKHMITEAIARAVNPGFSSTDSETLPVFGLVLDRNQRVLAGLQAGDRPIADRALEVLARHPVDEGQEIRAVAPVQIVPNVLAPGLCQRLIKLWQSEGHEEGLVYQVDAGKNVHKVDFEQKRRLDHVIQDQALIALLRRRSAPGSPTKGSRLTISGISF